jgi:hypothetical protein
MAGYFVKHRRQIHTVTEIQVLTEASMKLTAFWDMVSCSLVVTDQSDRHVDGGSAHL